jgi:hypothetical protein
VRLQRGFERRRTGSGGCAWLFLFAIALIIAGGYLLVQIRLGSVALPRRRDYPNPGDHPDPHAHARRLYSRGRSRRRRGQLPRGH